MEVGSRIESLNYGVYKEEIISVRGFFLKWVISMIV